MNVISIQHIGKIIHEDIYSSSGVLLLKKRSPITAEHLLKLSKHDYYFHSSYLEEKESNYYKQKAETLYRDNADRCRMGFEKIQNNSEEAMLELTSALLPIIDNIMEDALFGRYLDEVKSYDNYTYVHSMNVGIYASVIGKVLGLSKNDITLLGIMGILHDVGKLSIEKEILSKPGKLSNSEWLRIKMHPTLGYQLLKTIPDIDPYILQGALLHHEKLDGTGYPLGLKQENIPYLVQVLSVADVYDALSSERSYRPKLSIFETTKILMDEAKSNKLNIAIVKPYVKYLLSNYTRNNVILSSGEEAELIFIHEDEPHLPLIRIGDNFIDLRKNSSINIVDLAG